MTTPANGQSTYRFADLTLDVPRRRVTRQGRPIELKALDFDLLRFLVESAPEVVNSDVLAEKVWGRHFVSPENVAQRVMLLRQSLADDANRPRYIETVRNKGYRLIPGVQAVSSPPPAATDRRRLATVAAALLLAVGGVYLLGPRPAETVDAAPREPLPSSVAILPIQNLSPDAADAYFAAGIHAEIIGQLARVPGLSVIATTSVQRYANADKPIQEIAAELNVETVMEGSVRYSGHRVRVTTNLIDAATGASRWSEVYERELGEVFAIQEDIAANITAALGAEFPLRQHARSYGTTSPEAAALYLKVLTLQRQCSYDGGQQLSLLDKALAFDNQFANAYAMRGMLYAISVIDCSDGRAHGAEEHETLEKLALDNAAQALELDPTSTQAYLAIATVHWHFWRWDYALDAFEKAYELSPNDVEVLRGFGNFLSSSGYLDRAIEILERARQIDGDSPRSHLALGDALWQTGETARALAVLRLAAPRWPTVAGMRFMRGRMEAIEGNLETALTEVQAAERLSMPWQNASQVIAVMNSYRLIGGREEDIRRLAREAKTLQSTGPVGAGTWTAMHLALGEVEQAHHWLTIAVDKVKRQEPDAGFTNLVAVKWNKFGYPVLDEPRFRALRDQIGALD